MSEKKLTQLLEQLHNELDATEAMDEKGRELLRALNADIQELLARSEGGQTDESLLARLQESVDHFADTHPTLTSILSHLMTALSNVGI